MISTRTIKREKCKFCGKELEQKTMSFILRMGLRFPEEHQAN